MRFLWVSVAIALCFPVTSSASAVVVFPETVGVPRSWQDEGSQLLEKAFETSANATSIRELDEVVSLCEQALKAGLDEKETDQAQKLMVSSLLAAADEHLQRIFVVDRDRRWRIFRREALTRLEKALTIQADLAKAHLHIARLNMLEGGDTQLALQSIEKAIEHAGSDMRFLSQALMARSQMATTDEERLASLNQAVKVDPDNFEAVFLRGMLYLKMEDYEDALVDAKRMVELQPDNLGAVVLAADILIEMDQRDEAIALLSEAIESHPTESTLYSKRARLRIALDQLDAAMDDAEEALKLNKDDIEALYVRVTVYAERKQFEDALRDLEQILKLDRNSVRGIWVRSIVYAQAEKYEESLRDLRMLVSNAPDVEMFQLQLAAVLNADEQAEEAIQIYDRILAESPDNEQALRGRGDARLTTGEHADAIRDYERCLEIDPDDDGVLNNLAWVLATSPFDELRDGKRAIELATKACEIREFKAAHILSTLASAYAEIGDFENALKWAEKAVELAEAGKQHENLSKELESYKVGKPWREFQPDARKKKAETNGDVPPADKVAEDDQDGGGQSESDSDKDG